MYYSDMRFSLHRPVWQKCFAAILLLWALADLSVPGLCQSDDDGSQDAQALSQFAGASQVGQQAASVTQLRMASNPGQQSAPSSQEDCFCCCAHIVPAPYFYFASLQRCAASVTFYHFNQVTASAPPLYHPPRG
jgi:hypothetical protein